MMNTTSNEHQPEYLFLSGIVKSKEAELISSGKLERMRLSNSLDDFFSILTETVYGEIVPLSKSVLLFEKYLSEKLFSFEDELLSLLKDENLKKVFMIDYDFHNIKLLLMSYFSGHSMPEDGTAPGFLDIDLLKSSINEDDFSMLPELIKETIMRSKEVYEKEKSIQKAMITIDKDKYKIKLIIAGRLGSDFLTDLARSEIDLQNAAFLFRAKILEFDFSMLNALLFEDGYIEKKVYLDLLDSTPDAIADAFKSTDYLKGIQSAINEYKEKGSIASFETYIKNHIIRRSKEVSNHIFGFEPLVGLIYAKRHEVYNLKSIYIAKEYSLSEEELEFRLGEAYVS